MNFGTTFNVAHLEPTTHIYGPGPRFTIWLQGCTLACQGCWNTEMWPHRPQHLLDRNELLERIISTPNIEGVTLLGGEPMQQAENTLWLLQQLRTKTALNIMLYTGYERAELEGTDNWQCFEALTDLIVSGRYEHNLRNTGLLWRGSENQQLVYPVGSRLKKQDQRVNQLEIVISEHGGVTVLGYPD